MFIPNMVSTNQLISVFWMHKLQLILCGGGRREGAREKGWEGEGGGKCTREVGNEDTGSSIFKVVACDAGVFFGQANAITAILNFKSRRRLGRVGSRRNREKIYTLLYNILQAKKHNETGVWAMRRGIRETGSVDLLVPRTPFTEWQHV